MPWSTQTSLSCPMSRSPRSQQLVRVPPHTLDSLTHMDCYMDDIVSEVQVGPGRQHIVFDGTVSALKWIFPSFPGELKDSVSMKELVMGEGYWTCAKEVLGWILYMDAGTVTLP